MYVKYACVCLLAMLPVSLWVGGCGQGASTPSQKPDVFVDIAPLAFFVTQIAGDRLGCEVLVPPGREPHTFQPTAKQITRLAGSKVFFTAGLPFTHRIAEKLATMASAPTIVDLSKGITLIDADRPSDHHEHAEKGPVAEAIDDDHGHEHGHGAADPHFWMSPANAQKITRAVCRELSARFPEHREQFEKNAEALITRLESLDEQMSESLAPLAGGTFFVFHPAFGYLAEAYGLHQRAIETEGKSPSPRRVIELVEAARAAGVKVIFVQPQFSPEAARTIAEQIDGVVVELDPLSGDYIANLESVAYRIAQAIGDGGAAKP